MRTPACTHSIRDTCAANVQRPPMPSPHVAHVLHPLSVCIHAHPPVLLLTADNGHLYTTYQVAGMPRQWVRATGWDFAGTVIDILAGAYTLFLTNNRGAFPGADVALGGGGVQRVVAPSRQRGCLRVGAP
jgi:hypothetical protein